MKTIIISILFIVPVLSFAQTDCDTENNLEKIAKGITYPNCNTPANIRAFKSYDREKLCQSCKADFEIVNGPITENKSHLQEEFLNSALSEYKKNVTNNLLNSIKMKVIYSTGNKLQKSIDACRMKTAADFAKSCKSPAAIKLLNSSSFFENLSKELANDVALILSTDPTFKPTPTLLQRSPQQCPIPERDILLMSTSTYEEALSPEIIEAFKKQDPKKFKTVTDMITTDEFLDNFGDLSELKDSLYNHPLFAAHLKNPEKFISFLKSIPTPANTVNLRKVLYSKQNGESFDHELAKSCETSAKVLKDAICSDEFEKGKLFIDPVDNFSKLNVSKTPPSDEALSATENLVDTNIKLLELCENKDEKSKKNLSLVNLEIGYALNDGQKKLDLDLFKAEKYNSEIGSLHRNLCSMTDASCKEESISCSIYKKLQESRKKGTPSQILASSSNSDVNELLRVMIGDTSKIDSKTKAILISQGIIAKDNGEIIAQPEVDRKPEALPLPSNQQQTQQGQNSKTSFNTPKTSPVTGKSNAGTGRSPASDNTFDEGYSNVGTKSISNGPDFSDLMEDQQELRNIQDEIKRRLLGSPDKKPTENEARKIVRDSFKSRKQQLSPEMEDAFTNRIMESNTTTPQAFANSTQIAQPSTDNRAAVSGGDSATAKWRKQQDQNALMGMAGAQQALGKDSSNTAASAEAKPKDLTKVALNLGEDPRVNLSEIFNRKIDQNDSETQLLKVLLRSKNNFLLQIKSMNFKVVFDEKNNFNVLLESGDKQEAARIRPQLEMFLKKLKT